MQVFLEQFYSALAWFSALAAIIFTLWLLASLWERVQLSARRKAFKQPKSGNRSVHAFLLDWCNRAPKARIYASNLYDAYRIWCKDHEQEALSRNAFGHHMTKMKIKREKGQWVQYLGLELNVRAKRRLAVENRTNR